MKKDYEQLYYDSLYKIKILKIKIEELEETLRIYESLNKEENLKILISRGLSKYLKKGNKNNNRTN